eukprot:TRINITY_DN26077_c0_g1_i2.p1 TRINITY_DN26077_c0_g1~~TRINITY_DN26077_c0_g1_i2.p1  ORF type:complete len:509 (+),score=119.53 TRINITY_DN26077_c0_g1_i2:91-1527(+)
MQHGGSDACAEPPRKRRRRRESPPPLEAVAAAWHEMVAHYAASPPAEPFRELWEALPRTTEESRKRAAALLRRGGAGRRHIQRHAGNTAVWVPTRRRVGELLRRIPARLPEALRPVLRRELVGAEGAEWTPEQLRRAFLPLMLYAGDTCHMVDLLASVRGLRAALPPGPPTAEALRRALGQYGDIAAGLAASAEALRRCAAECWPAPPGHKFPTAYSMRRLYVACAKGVWPPLGRLCVRALWVPPGWTTEALGVHEGFASFSLCPDGACEVLELYSDIVPQGVDTPVLLVAPQALLLSRGVVTLPFYPNNREDMGTEYSEQEVVVPPFSRMVSCDGTPVGGWPAASVLEATDSCAAAWARWGMGRSDVARCLADLRLVCFEVCRTGGFPMCQGSADAPHTDAFVRPDPARPPCPLCSGGAGERPVSAAALRCAHCGALACRQCGVGRLKWSCREADGMAPVPRLACARIVPLADISSR